MNLATAAKERRETPWLRVALLVALVYPVVGVAFAALDRISGPAVLRPWRLAAWVVSAAVFGLHLAYEHLRLRSSALRAAAHCSLAVGLGALALAAWVILRRIWAASSPQSPLAPLALVVFPLVTAVPAFLVALGAGAVLARMRGRSR